MALAEPSFTVGIEEEYILVDRATRDLALDPPAGLFAECERRLGQQVKPEFLKCQVEVATGVCAKVSDARNELRHLRRTVAEVAANFGLAPIAAGTHPFGRWQTQKHTDKERYDLIARDLQGVARRLIICGLHVHVGIEDEELRIDLMNQAAYFLPHLLCLGASSPFWQGEDTGLKSFRLSIFGSLPRTGLPERFDSQGDYQRMIGRMVGAKLIDDPSKIWWDLRPSARFPTLEMRICDVPTEVEHSLAIAALYQSVLGMLFRLRKANQRWRIYPLTLLNENRWRAQRYGLQGDLVDFGKGELVPYAELLEELIALTRADAESFDCVTELDVCRRIVAEGNSADRQLRLHKEALARGASAQEALYAVVDNLIARTAAS